MQASLSAIILLSFLIRAWPLLYDLIYQPKLQGFFSRLEGVPVHGLLCTVTAATLSRIAMPAISSMTCPGALLQAWVLDRMMADWSCTISSTAILCLGLGSLCLIMLQGACKPSLRRMGLLTQCIQALIGVMMIQAIEFFSEIQDFLCMYCNVRSLTLFTTTIVSTCSLIFTMTLCLLT